MSVVMEGQIPDDLVGLKAFQGLFDLFEGSWMYQSGDGNSYDQGCRSAVEWKPVSKSWAA